MFITMHFSNDATGFNPITLMPQIAEKNSDESIPKANNFQVVVQLQTAWHILTFLGCGANGEVGGVSVPPSPPPVSTMLRAHILAFDESIAVSKFLFQESMKTKSFVLAKSLPQSTESTAIPRDGQPEYSYRTVETYARRRSLLLANAFPVVGEATQSRRLGPRIAQRGHRRRTNGWLHRTADEARHRSRH